MTYSRGAKVWGGGGGRNPPDFSRPFLIALRRNAKIRSFIAQKFLNVGVFNRLT